MIWSISSEGFDTMSVGPQGANERHRPSWCEGPCGWWPPLSVACVLSHPSNSASTDLEAWRVQRRRLQNRHQARVLQRRFRRQPDEYLAALEERLIKLSLPP